MPSVQDVVARLNDAVRRDWKSMHNLIDYRVMVNAPLLDHPTIIVVPMSNSSPQQYLAGLLGIINGLVRETNDDAPIEACYNNGELCAFKLRGDTSPVVDVREIAITQLQPGNSYRVRDRAGNFWEGVYTGPGEPPEQGVYLRLQDGTTARVWFHDVANIINA